MQTLVITSVNPFSKMAYQRSCFDAWKEAGYSVRTLNAASEAELLIQQGFDESDIEIIAESETSLGLFGKPIPRILPTLNRALHHDHDALILTNSDIYPFHNRPASGFLAGVGDVVALTRNECYRVQDQSYVESKPYRGGLDIFFFTRLGLRKTFDHLVEKRCSERMTFGIPGWDYYLGHHFITDLGGKIIDGEIFLHQTHKTTYSALDEFIYYAEEMRESGLYTSYDHVVIAEEFAKIIDRECRNNQALSKTLKAALVRCTPIKNVEERFSSAAIDISERFWEMLRVRDVKFSTERTAVMSFVDGQLENQDGVAADSFISDALKGYPTITQRLFTLALEIMIKRVRLGHFSFVTEYPATNVHAQAVQQILDNTEGDAQLRYLFDLFRTELIEFGIFNYQLFSYFIWTAHNDRALGLCDVVLTLCKADD